ncbi:EscF/YscF/HrpA family type III secretion system needle major subunit [Providencia heimbachae]|uniref:Type III secretion apparatus needle protein n=1 Tax=Providencia heimbachae ATCC 35613 TaxID=1354272 RepID=A0A1B7JTY3_9GAMM|nr:EscF/YscF/HrpA family type III secretion system needle major subunit [Providencia heimbachae]OAT51367.1 hypothetical protein M998_2304 [Providencia heimbachae ATCC 35613]QCJ68531.1 type III secretion apparatus needle protein [Providencia heimbachae]SQH11531.1 Uncharacterised protein [Providencia heimbachae]
MALVNGNWAASTLEADRIVKDSSGQDIVDNGKWGMMYRSSAGISDRVKVVGDELKSMLDNPSLEVDNPLVLGKITALSGNYNMARQLQSNVMKSIKDAAQAIIRNV